MAGPSELDPPRAGPVDPTRAIRMPPPGHPPPAPPPVGEPPRPDAGSEGPLADQPTDRLASPPAGDRDRTLTFDGTSAQRWAAGHAATPDPAWSSVPPVSGPVVGPRSRRSGPRRWPWIVVTLVPVLVIVVTGVWLLVLMQSG